MEALQRRAERVQRGDSDVHLGNADILSACCLLVGPHRLIIAANNRVRGSGSQGYADCRPPGCAARPTLMGRSSELRTMII
jgi:hypothetical protein